MGQKRKRVTRKSMRDEAKRREAELSQDAFNSYIPPPKPPIKATEVHVPVIREVRTPRLWWKARKLTLSSVFIQGITESMTMTAITL